MNDIQKVILNIFKEIKEVCNRNNIRYFAIGGTCIGAVRHRGFIPWDDDLDIAIPIEQFDLFKDCCNKELPSYLKIYGLDTIKEYPNIFIKVIDERTTFVEEIDYRKPELFKGVYVDVMPIAGVPEDEQERNKYFKRLHRNINLNKLVRAGMLISTNPLKIFAKKLLLQILRFQDINKFTSRIYKEMRSRPFFESVYTGYTWEYYDGRALSFPTKWFEKIELFPFEDTEMCCPKEFDKYLKYQFGDYMKLPPEDKRVTPHKSYIDLNKSYHYYQNNPTELIERIKEQEATL